ncbi:MAG: hypothetical protein ACPGLV_14435 [Bacteroidia bacterium]
MAIKRWIMALKSLVRKELTQLDRKNALIQKFPDAIFQNDIQLVGKVENLHIESGAKINKFAYLNTGGQAYEAAGKIYIGTQSVIGVRTTLFAGGGSIIIGNNCDIGVGVLILAHAFMGFKDQQKQVKDFTYYKLVIGNETNISSGAIIVGNTQIGNNCTITPGAVVNGIFGDNLLISGNPARGVPKGFLA